MKVEIKIDPTLEEEKVVLYAREYNKDVMDVMERLKRPMVDRIIGYEKEKINQLLLVDVYYFYTEQQKVMVRTNNHHYEVKMKMYELEHLLEHSHFVRISQSTIANINKIKSLEMSFNGFLCLNFTNGDVEYSSRRYVKKIKERLGL